MTRLEFQPNLEHLTEAAPITPATAPFAPIALQNALERNPRIRCSIPSIYSVSPDILRQFYRPGIPQTRITPPPVLGSRYTG